MAEVSILVMVWALPIPDWIKGTVTALCTIGLVWRAIKAGIEIGSRDQWD